jgi:hypothetical protein
MNHCKHQGFHTISSSYDRETMIMTCFRRCDRCGARLGDVSRLVYEPRFDPNGNDRFLSGRLSRSPIADRTAEPGIPR